MAITIIPVQALEMRRNKMPGGRTVVVAKRVTLIERALIETLAYQEGCRGSSTDCRILMRVVKARLREDLGVALSMDSDLPTLTEPGQDA